ncbi:MAG: hypothetical protein ABI365_02635, partial [Lysobacteraceae bacterium]
SAAATTAADGRQLRHLQGIDWVTRLGDHRNQRRRIEPRGYPQLAAVRIDVDLCRRINVMDCVFNDGHIRNRAIQLDMKFHGTPRSERALETSVFDSSNIVDGCMVMRSQQIAMAQSAAKTRDGI